MMTREEEKLCSKMLLDLYLQGKVDLDDDELYTISRLIKISDATVEDMVYAFKLEREEHKSKG